MIPTIASWCYPPDGTILMHPSRWYHHNATNKGNLPLLSNIPMLPSWCNQVDAIILLLLSWFYHLKKQKHSCVALSTWCFCLDATFPMPYCWIDRNGLQYHIWNAFTFLVKLEERNKHVVRRKFKNDGKKNGPNNLDAQALPSGCYHPDATTARWPSWGYPPEATIPMLPSPHNPDVTILMLPYQHYLPKVITPTLLPWCYHHDATVLMLLSWHNCPKATISTLPSWCYCLDTTNLMLPSLCCHPIATALMLLS